MAAPNDTPYPRDLIGYGEHPPDPRWPNGARLAVSFVLNYEEGAENTILNGDPHSETFIHEVPSPTPLQGLRNVNTESSYDYGARAGVWRVLRLFEGAGFPLTVFAVGQALEGNPDVGRAFARHGHEVASHHWRWIDYLHVDEDVEREHIRRSIDVIEELTGHRPVGWYGGRTSLQSRRLAVEAGCFLYDSDVYDDDLPHWTRVDGKNLLLIPYSFDTNDFKFSISPGFSSGEDFGTYLRNSFDFLYEEGARSPKMMSIGLHCRMVGRPGRAAALRRFLEYLRGFDDVWVCRRADIAEHWYTNFPPGELGDQQAGRTA
jgi:putative urate catabolism protein